MGKKRFGGLCILGGGVGFQGFHILWCDPGQSQWGLIAEAVSAQARPAKSIKASVPIYPQKKGDRLETGDRAEHSAQRHMTSEE